MSLIEKLSHPAVTMTAAVAVAAALVTPSALAQDNGSVRCPDNLVVAFPGTGETNAHADPNAQVGMLANITRPLTTDNGANRVQAYYVPYPAVALDPGTGMTYAQSKKAGVDKATQEISARMAECPNTHFSLTGYSQGADAAGDLAAAIGSGRSPIPADRISSVALLSDPGQSPADATSAGAGAEGFAGGRGGLGALQDRATWVCNDDDIYCNTPTDKPALAMLGQLGANIDPSDPVGSMTAIVNAVSTDVQPGMEGQTGDAANPDQVLQPTQTGAGPRQFSDASAGATPAGAQDNLLAQLLRSVEDAARAGDPVAAEKQLNAARGQFSSLGQNMTSLSGEIGPIIAELDTAFQALLRGDLIGAALTVANLVPRVITFATHVATSIGQVVSRMPVAEFSQLAITTAGIVGAVTTQNYGALPPLIGTWVGQASNVGGKVAQSGVLEELPGLAQTVFGLPEDALLDQAVDFATFLASGAHTNYATQTLASGMTGTQEISSHIGQNLV